MKGGHGPPEQIGGCSYGHCLTRRDGMSEWTSLGYDLVGRDEVAVETMMAACFVRHRARPIRAAWTGVF